MRAFIRLYLVILALAILDFCVALLGGQVELEGWNISSRAHFMIQDAYGFHESHLISIHCPTPLFVGLMLFVVGVIAGVGWIFGRFFRLAMRL